MPFLSRQLSNCVNSVNSSVNSSNRLGATPAAYLPDYLPSLRKEFKFVSDFKEGFNRVHYDYLNLFWTYSISRAMRYILPFFMVLASTRFFVPELGQSLTHGFDLSLRGIYRLSSVVDAMLLLPLKAAYAVATTLPPLMMIPLLEYMPQSAVVGIVSPLLSLRRLVKILGSSFFFSTVGISIWRPVLEETQYRFILSSVLGDKGLRRWFGRSKSTISEESMATVHMDKNDLPVSKTTKGKISKTCLWTSFFFAVTRFGWLCSNFDDGSTSPYSWAVGFSLSLLGHLSSVSLSEVRPVLQYALLFLSLHQAVSTFLVAVNIYEPMYREKGLIASIGSHVAWTTGIPTIPFRIAKRIYDGSKKNGPNTVMTEMCIDCENENKNV
ncbi:unnamed protein product [Cylindrotheca closterium]|uniref:Uncharacterized protein n=1 Tax=Cylindrotheca closterium TaxID=2856 RepID=A0AAD2CJZ9_9STRA|nr:unnamed protein product [Cylindrotheca closterium]